jgi:hypothetical protein
MTVKLIKEQVSEAWGPGLTDENLRNYFTWVQPVSSLDGPTLNADNHAASIRTENSWFYDDPKVTRQAVQVYSALAKRFNEIQSRDPASDGAVARAYGQYLSAFFGISLPLPKSASKFSLTTMKNLKQASNDLGLEVAISKCVYKNKMINARAAVASDHHVYMCDKGEGFVHAHRVKLDLH